jgi:hypothetical protein
VLLLCLAVAPHGRGQSRAELSKAVVRLPSHGASATVIETANGRTVLLGCGHAFQGANRNKAIVVDMPCTHPGPPLRVGVKLLKVDGMALPAAERNADLLYPSV